MGPCSTYPEEPSWAACTSARPRIPPSLAKGEQDKRVCALVRPLLRRRLCRRCHGGFLLAKAFDYHEQHRHKKNADNRSRRHTDDDSAPQDLAADCARTLRSPQGHAPQNECKGGHQDRSQSQPGTLKGRVDEFSSFLLVLQFGKLDDQDGV